MKLTKVVEFCAAHHIPRAGKCSNNHGHNWIATIHVEADMLDSRGFIADVADIKQAAFKYDHGDLNGWFDSPTTENVAQAIADDVLLICIDSNRATYRVRVHLQETRNNSAEAQATNYVNLF